MSVQQPRTVEPRRLGLNQVFPSQDEDSSGKDIDIVAIHGLDTQSPKTWVAWKNDGDPTSGEVHWLQDSDMLPKVLPNARIFTYDWNAGFDRSPATDILLGHADVLLDRLHIRRSKDTRDRPIIFIASCFGGLLLVKALHRALEIREYQGILRLTVGVAFLGTPFQGSHESFYTATQLRIAVALQMGGEASHELVKYLRSDAGGLGQLDELVQRFCEMAADGELTFPMVCFYETQRTDFSNIVRNLPPEFVEQLDSDSTGILVPRHSACLQGSRRFGLDVRHSMLSKYAGPEDDAFARVSFRLEEFSRNAQQTLLAKEIALAKVPLTGRINALVEFTASQEHQAILDWLTPLEFGKHQTGLQRRREPNTGNWFIRLDKFRSWLDTPQTTLFCPGMPGAGKSFIASIVIDHLQNTFLQGQGVGIAFLFCNFSSRHEQRPEDLLASLLQQLVQRRAVPKNLQVLFELYKSRPRGSLPSISEICTCLHTAITAYSRVFIVIDALDECDMGYRTIFLESIFELHASTKLNILATSRPIQEIAGVFEDSTRILHVIEIQADEDDVQMFLDSRISRSLPSIRRSYQLREDVKKEIGAAVRGMFLLAQLYLDHVASHHSELKVRKALKDLPTGPNAYDAMYSDTIGRIREKPHKALAMRVLSLIVWAKRPLTTQEVQHALAIDDGTEYLDKTSITDVEDIVSACEGLVRLDYKDSTLQLAHYTVQEYLLKNRRILFSDPDPECFILEICLDLLVSPAFATGFCPTDEEFEKRLDSFPLYNYAARTWGAHALYTPGIDGRVLELLQDRPKLEAMAQCLMAYRRYGQEVPRLMTGLHIAALFGLETEVDALLAAGWDSNVRNTYKRSPLSFAAEHGREAIVQELLRQGAELDSRDNVGKTAFFYACQGGFQTIAEILMGHGAGANTQLRDDFGRSPISYAAQHGHKGIVELLIRRGDTQVDAKNINGITPLGWAAFGGNLAMTRLLVENKVNVNPRDSTGMTPAMRAAKGGHADVFRYLVEEGADANVADKEGRTSLSHAAELGHQAVVEACLSRSEADPDLGDGDGWTPLFWAVNEGWAGIVVALLADERVDVNHQDRFGQTALSIAARIGDEAVTKVLLDRKGIQVDVPDYTGWTPLIQAAKNGSEKILRLLFAVEEGGVSIDPNQPDAAGQTALHWAANMGNVGAVRILVSHPLINVHMTDSAGRSPMWRAAVNGHVATVPVLLGARAEVNTQESSGRTALRAAVERGQDEVAELLLAQGADPEHSSTSHDSWALLHVALFTASSRLQRLLETNRAVGTDPEDDFFGLVSLFDSNSCSPEPDTQMILNRPEI